MALREQTRRELKLLQHRLSTTSLYVTHDQQEALALSDRIGVMRAGRLLQVGAPEQLYQEPETAFVAQFLGGSNLVRDPSLAARLAGEAPPTGHVLAVRPEHLRPGDRGPVQARLHSRQFLGTYDEWWLDAGGQSLRAFVDPQTQAGETIRLAATAWRWVREEQTTDDGSRTTEGKAAG